jgi:hypothetical protein
LSVFFSSCDAFQFISKNTLPADNLSAGRVAALTKDIANFLRQISSFATGSYVDVDALEKACIADCETLLTTYNSETASACGLTDVYSHTETRVAPMRFVSELLYYYYYYYYYYFNQTCIQDGERWCNRVSCAMLNDNAMSGLVLTDKKASNQKLGSGNCFIYNRPLVFLETHHHIRWIVESTRHHLMPFTK